MPNRETHLGIGLAIFIAYWFVLDFFSKTQFFLYGASVFLGAILPDLLEPCKSKRDYDHRGVLHSKRALKKLWIVAGVSLILSIIFPIFLIVLLFSLGYISHLLADSKFVGVHIRGNSWSRGLPN